MKRFQVRFKSELLSLFEDVLEFVPSVASERNLGNAVSGGADGKLHNG